MSDDSGPDPVASLNSEWTTTREDSPESLERQLAEQRLRTDQLTLLGSAIHVSGQGIAILTPAVEAVGPRVAFVNDGFCSIYHRRKEEIIGETLQVFGIVEQHSAVLTALLHHIFESRPFHGEATAVRPDHSEFEVDIEVVPVSDQGQLTHWVAFIRDITEAKSQVVTLRHQAMHDALSPHFSQPFCYDSR